MTQLDCNIAESTTNNLAVLGLQYIIQKEWIIHNTRQIQQITKDMKKLKVMVKTNSNKADFLLNIRNH